MTERNYCHNRRPLLQIPCQISMSGHLLHINCFHVSLVSLFSSLLLVKKEQSKTRTHPIPHPTSPRPPQFSKVVCQKYDLSTHSTTATTTTATATTTTTTTTNNNNNNNNNDDDDDDDDNNSNKIL